MKIALKRLTENELELLMHWRMSEEVNKYMTTSPRLTLEGQHKWFDKIKDDKTQIRWIIWVDDTPIGSMYLTDIDYDHMRCSGPGWFIVEKKYLDLKQTIALQRNCYDFVFDVLGLNRLYGDVISTNQGVIRLNMLCGHEIEGTLKEHIKKDGQFYDVVLVGLTKEAWYAKKEQMNYETIDIER